MRLLVNLNLLWQHLWLAVILRKRCMKTAASIDGFCVTEEIQELSLGIVEPMSLVSCWSMLPHQDDLTSGAILCGSGIPPLTVVKCNADGLLKNSYAHDLCMQRAQAILVVVWPSLMIFEPLSLEISSLFTIQNSAR
jgi:hypothetical protein